MTTQSAPHHDPYAWTLGDKLRKIRRVHELTQDQFAAEIGVNPKSLAAWESDSWLPRGIVSLAKRIHLRYRDVEVGWLLGLDTPEPPAGDDSDEGPDDGVRRQGLEPRTRYIRITPSGRVLRLVRRHPTMSAA